MTRHSQIVTTGDISIETYLDGDVDGPGVVLPSYGCDGGDDFDPLTAALAGAGYHVLRPQPRGIARSTGPMTGVTLDDIADDIAFHQKDEWGHLRSELGPRVTSTVIEGASHALFPEQSAAVAIAVLGYLRTLT